MAGVANDIDTDAGELSQTPLDAEQLDTSPDNDDVQQHDVVDPDLENEEVDSKLDETDETASTPFLGTWGTREDAEKGIAELQKGFTQSRQELSELKTILNSFATKASEQPPSKEVVEERLQNFLKDPDAYIAKLARSLAGEEIRQRDAAEIEFDTLMDAAEDKALKTVAETFKDVLTPEVLELRAKFLTPGYDKQMTKYLRQFNAGNYKDGKGGMVNLDEFNHALVEMATEKAIARLAGKNIQQTKAETKRDTKREERQKQRLGVHSSSGKARSFGTNDVQRWKSEKINALNNVKVHGL